MVWKIVLRCDMKVKEKIHRQFVNDKKFLEDTEI